jgi:hypothetical protein
LLLNAIFIRSPLVVRLLSDLLLFCCDIASFAFLVVLTFGLIVFLSVSLLDFAYPPLFFYSRRFVTVNVLVIRFFEKALLPLTRLSSFVQSVCFHRPLIAWITFQSLLSHQCSRSAIFNT